MAYDLEGRAEKQRMKVWYLDGQGQGDRRERVVWQLGLVDVKWGGKVEQHGGGRGGGEGVGGDDGQRLWGEETRDAKCVVNGRRGRRREGALDGVGHGGL